MLHNMVTSGAQQHQREDTHLSSPSHSRRAETAPEESIPWTHKPRCEPFLMRRKHSKLRMGFRGRSGLLACILLGTTVLVVIYYAWNNYFSSSTRISISSVQGLEREHLDKWERERQAEIGHEDPHIGLNKEIELQVANEKWKKAKALQDHIDEERIAEEKAAQLRGKGIDNIIKAKEEDKQQQPASGVDRNALLFRPDPSEREYFSKLDRIVHLDLKGAPPLVSYLEKLFPLLKIMGATGILMEYEDMFPYTGNLSMLSSAGAYSQSDLQRIQEAARLSRLEIIPLVQTFGHMEFVLKFKAFMNLREHEYTPQVITPVKEASYTLIFDMLSQVLKAHPKARRVHLGCDEVYNLGHGQSNFYLTSQRLTPEKLFLQHVSKIVRHLKTTLPSVQPLIWDDWLRGIPYEDLAVSGLAGLVEPVVWFYQHNIMDRVPPSVWDNYSRLFSAVWVASAFKGATGSAQILTNASLHLDNNLQWVSVVRKYGIQTKKIKFQGAVLTGWQRYDHFATLCELLPVGLPSLSLNLQAWTSGGFGPKEIDSARRVLKCSNVLDLEFPSLKKTGAVITQDCWFPGDTIFYGVQQLWGILEVYRRDRGLQEQISGWMTDYQIRQGISNPGHMKVLARKLEKVMSKLREQTEPMRKTLLEIYDKWTVDEWITTNVEDKINYFKDLYTKANKFLERKDWPARPFAKPSTVPPGTNFQPGGAQVGAQVGSQKLPSQNNGVAQPGAQSVSGRLQIHPYGQNRAGGNVALNRPGQGKLGLGIGQKQSAGNGGLQGGVLSQTLLKKQGQGMQGRPSGPSKMQYGNQGAARLSPQQGQRQQFGNAQDARQQQLGQYVQGLSLGQKQSALNQNQYMGNQNPRLPLDQKQSLPGQNYVAAQNPQGPRKNQYAHLQIQQNQGSAQNFNAQPVKKSDGRIGFGQNVQNQQQNQPALVRKPQPLLPQGNFKQPELVQPKGSQSVKNGPVNQQRQNLLKEQGTEPKMPGVKKAYDQQVQLPSNNKYPESKNHGPPKTEHGDKGQDDTVLLDSFVGRRGKNKQDVKDNVDNHKGDDDRKKAGQDYMADDDDPM